MFEETLVCCVHCIKASRLNSQHIRYLFSEIANCNRTRLWQFYPKYTDSIIWLAGSSHARSVICLCSNEHGLIKYKARVYYRSEY